MFSRYFSVAGFSWSRQQQQLRRSALAHGARLVLCPLFGPERWAFVFASAPQARAWFSVAPLLPAQQFKQRGRFVVVHFGREVSRG